MSKIIKYFKFILIFEKNKMKQYFDYLIYIGVILPENTEQLKLKLKNIKKSNKNDNNIFIKNLIGEYLSSLNKESLNKLGLNIYEQYFKNRKVTLCKHLIKIFNIFQNLFYRHAKYCFNFWKNKNCLIKNNNTANRISRSQSSDKLSKLSQYYDNIDFNRFSAYSNYLNAYKKSQKDFFERMNKYNKQKENNKKLHESLKEDEINLFCTFSPDLTLTKKNNNSKKPIPFNKNHIIKEYISEEKPKRKVNNEAMIKLYNDYHQSTLRKEKLKESIDKENGLTFSPRVNKDSKYNKNIRDNFYERNNKLIIDKKNFIEGFNLVRDLQLKGIDVNMISIDVSKIK